MLEIRFTLSPSGCWTWAGSYSSVDGYGRLGGSSAHRSVYELLVGPIPPGLQLDHTCHNAALAEGTCSPGVCDHRRCVNPAHLEPVTNRVNGLRSGSFSAANAAKTHCVNGHPFDAANTYTLDLPGQSRRCCRACNAEAQARYKARLRGAA